MGVSSRKESVIVVPGKGQPTQPNPVPGSNPGGTILPKETLENAGENVIMAILVLILFSYTRVRANIYLPEPPQFGDEWHLLDAWIPISLMEMETAFG